MKKLEYKDINDNALKSNFKMIEDDINQGVFRNGNFKFAEVVIDGAQTNYKFKHNLTFIPKDIIHLSTIGTGIASYNYNLFDRDYIYITTTNTCTIRFFVGTYRETKI